MPTSADGLSQASLLLPMKLLTTGRSDLREKLLTPPSLSRLARVVDDLPTATLYAFEAVIAYADTYTGPPSV